ncbi:MAG: DNA-binding protein WhiA [Chloroflexota bacterium]
MVMASEVKGELARIQPARDHCQRAELAGLLAGDRMAGGVSTLDHATARVALQLAALLGISAAAPRRAPAGGAAEPHARHHLRVVMDRAAIRGWSWTDAAACDRRAWLRGMLLGSASISFAHGGPHFEWVFRSRSRAADLRRRLSASEVRAALLERRGRHVVYVKGNEEVATLLRLTGANRALLDFETSRVGHEVQNRLNRVINAEAANLRRTVRAAERQLSAIRDLESRGLYPDLPLALREAADLRRLHPDADLDTLATSLGVSRSAMNHRLRRLVELAAED